MNSELKGRLWDMGFNVAASILVILLSLVTIRACEFDSDYYRQLSLDARNALAVALTNQYVETVTAYPEFKAQYKAFVGTPTPKEAAGMICSSRKFKALWQKTKCAVLTSDAAPESPIVSELNGIIQSLDKIINFKSKLHDLMKREPNLKLLANSNQISTEYEHFINAIEDYMKQYPKRAEQLSF